MCVCVYIYMCVCGGVCLCVYMYLFVLGKMFSSIFYKVNTSPNIGYIIMNLERENNKMIIISFHVIEKCLTTNRKGGIENMYLIL